MSYVNLPPEATFMKLNQVIKNQKRLMFTGVAFTTMVFGSVLASFAAMF
jgi:hypothetical protein